MIRILIHGIKDGQHDIEMTVPVSEIDNIFDEFFGDIYLTGKLRKLANRFSFVGKAECRAKLVCDLTLNEFTETIIADIAISFKVGSSALRDPDDVSDDKKEELTVADDQKYFDLSQEVSEQLAVNMPLKRISPEARNKEFDAMYPEYSANNKEINESGANDIWAPLKKLKNK